jgi:hypothetical protein
MLNVELQFGSSGIDGLYDPLPNISSLTYLLDTNADLSELLTKLLVEALRSNLVPPCLLARAAMAGGWGNL